MSGSQMLFIVATIYLAPHVSSKDGRRLSLLLVLAGLGVWCVE